MGEELTKNSEKVEIRGEHGRLLPGVVLNPNGRPKGARSFTTKVREALERLAEGKGETAEALLIKSLIHKAVVKQDVLMIKTIWEQLDGKPLQRVAADVHLDKGEEDRNGIKRLVNEALETGNSETDRT